MRIWNGCCQRCNKETIGHIMSMFNTQLICFGCKDSESKREDYDRARDADREAMKKGNYNYKGIGLKEEHEQD
jgi:hypothetical protein